MRRATQEALGEWLDCRRVRGKSSRVHVGVVLREQEGLSHLVCSDRFQRSDETGPEYPRSLFHLSRVDRNERAVVNAFFQLPSSARLEVYLGRRQLVLCSQCRFSCVFFVRSFLYFPFLQQ